MTDSRYFRLTNWDKHQNFRGKRAHWMKLSLDFFDDPVIVGLPDSQRLAFIGVMILCGKRGNLVPFDASYVRKRCSLRVTPDLELFLAVGLIEITQAECGAKPFPRYVEENRGEDKRIPVADAPVLPEPIEPPPTKRGVTLAKKPDGNPVLIVEPLPWNREAAELWRQEYRGDPPKQYFAALKPLVTRETWERVRPALVTYLAETPAEYVNIAGKFVAAFGTWEARAQGGGKRAPPPKETVADRSRRILGLPPLGGSGDIGNRVAVGPSQPVRRLQPGAEPGHPGSVLDDSERIERRAVSGGGGECDSD